MLIIKFNSQFYLVRYCFSLSWILMCASLIICYPINMKIPWISFKTGGDFNQDRRVCLRCCCAIDQGFLFNYRKKNVQCSNKRRCKSLHLVFSQSARVSKKQEKDFFVFARLFAYLIFAYFAYFKTFLKCITQGILPWIKYWKEWTIDITILLLLAGKLVNQVP